MRACLEIEGSEWAVDLGRPVSLAIEMPFGGVSERAPDGPNAFGAPRATALPLTVAGFTGRVAAGASCNCSTLTLTPHCNGTHTECAGHLTIEPLDAARVVPAGLLPAVLATVEPLSAGADRVVTPELLEAAWPRVPHWTRAVCALVMRTLPNDESKRRRDYTGGAAPYLAVDAARWLVERGIEHLVVDLPSIDPLADEGRLAAHRVFFGLPAGATDLARAARAQCTITELAFVPDSIADGEYLLELQVPALGGDAVPSRPLLFVAERGS